MSALTRVTVDPTLADEGCMCRFVFDTDDMVSRALERGTPLWFRCVRLITEALGALALREYRLALDKATTVRSLLTLHDLNLD